MWLLIPALACESPVPPAAFRDAVEANWTQHLQGQITEFRASLLDTERSIACLDAALTPLDAAAFHRNRAIGSLLAGDPDAARAGATAAVTHAPLEADAWIEASEEFATLAAGITAPSALQEFPTSLAALIVSDGIPRASRHTGLPVLVQVFHPDGAAVGGAWVDARASMPDWVTYPEPNCVERTRVDTMLTHARGAEQAFADLQVEDFESALRKVALGLPCLDQALSPTEASAIHRLEGLRLYTHRAPLGAMRSFQQAQLLDSATTLSSSIAREGSELATLWQRAGRAQATPWVPTGAPPDLHLRVDGLYTASRPATSPSIVQVVADDGGVVWTRYVPPIQALPAMDSLVPDAEAREIERLTPALRLYRERERGQGRRNLRTGLQAGGAGALLLSGVLLGVHASYAADFRDPITRSEELLRLRASANSTATASVVSAAAGALVIGASFAITTRKR